MGHDWTLLGLHFEWGSRNVKIDVLTPGGSRKIEGRSVVHISVPAELTWGPSSSILNLEVVKRLGSENLDLLIQMQSGDLIQIIGSDFELPPQ